MRAFEYLHKYIFTTAPRFTSSRDVQEDLNALGREGWELVDMTPDWKWTSETIGQEHIGGSEFGGLYYGVDAPYSVPDYIDGWYCTFKRGISDEEIRNYWIARLHSRLVLHLQADLASPACRG